MAIEIGASAARVGRNHGSWVAGADVAARIEAALAGVVGLAHDDLVLFIRDVVGTSVATQESVPAAFAVLRSSGDGHAWDACLLAASLNATRSSSSAMISPGSTSIRTTANLGTMGDKFPYVERESVAAMIVFLCSGAAANVNGQVIELA